MELTLTEVLVRLSTLIVCLSFHEAAHAWSADRLGDPTARMLGRLTLNPLAHIDWIGTVLFPLLGMYSTLPLIGWAKPVPVNPVNLRHPRRDFAMVAAAGPLSNLLLAFLCVLPLAILTTGEVTGSITAAILRYVIQLNVMLAVFNLLPVPPLDGGNVLAGLVPESAARVLDQLRPFGIFILYGLLLSGVLFYIWVPVDRLLTRWVP